MNQNQSTPQSGTRYRERRPAMFDVIFHNDNETTMDFVVEVLQSVFFKTEDEATRIMLDVHVKGEAVVGTYTFDIAHSKADKATEKARIAGFPLLITVHKKL